MAVTTYSTGTVSVGSGSTTLTGVGTAWTGAGVRAGDRFEAAGLSVRISSVDSATQITLARPWPGTALSGANYDIWLAFDDDRALVAANALLQKLTGGTLTSLGGLTGAANKLPYWTGPGVMAEADLTAAARAILALAGSSGAKVPVVTATGAAALRDIVGTVSQSAGVPTGAVVERISNANGEATRWADGTQIAVKRFSGLGPVSTANAGLYVSAAQAIGSFAVDFSAAPFLTARTGRPAAALSWGSFDFVQNPGSYTPSNNGSFRIVTPATNSNTDFSAEITAVGRWF